MSLKLVLKFLIASSIAFNIEAEIVTENLPTAFEDLMNITINECKNKENTTAEDVSSATTLIGDWPQSREGKCFIDCFLEAIGIVRYKSS